MNPILSTSATGRRLAHFHGSVSETDPIGAGGASASGLGL